MGLTEKQQEELAEKRLMGEHAVLMVRRDRLEAERRVNQRRLEEIRREMLDRAGYEMTSALLGVSSKTLYLARRKGAS